MASGALKRLQIWLCAPLAYVLAFFFAFEAQILSTSVPYPKLNALLLGVK
jgi:hypothetical protein